VAGWYGVVIAQDNSNQFANFGASRLDNHNNLKDGGPSRSCCMTVLIEEMAPWFAVGSYGFSSQPLGAVRANDATIDSSGIAIHPIFECLQELFIGQQSTYALCARPPRPPGARDAPPPCPSRTLLMMRVQLERCRFCEIVRFGKLPAGLHPVKAGGGVDHAVANGGGSCQTARFVNRPSLCRSAVSTWRDAGM
jgi:hypothetical protein